MRKKLMRALGVLILVTILVVAVESVRMPERVPQDSATNRTENQDVGQSTDLDVFTQALQDEVKEEVGPPIEGYEPRMFMQVYPGLLPEDFDRVDAAIGYYTFNEGALSHELGNTERIHSAASAITQEGMATLFENVRTRLTLTSTSDIKEVLAAISDEKTDDEAHESIACTADAKQCPDGSYVSRIGQNCEFAPCPGSSASSDSADRKDVTFCTDAMKNAEFCTMEYAPVCGLVEVQCITAPCDPVPETFSNGCTACSQGNVTSYTPGACESQ